MLNLDFTLPPVALLDSPWLDLTEATRWQIAEKMGFSFFPMTLSQAIDGKPIQWIRWTKKEGLVEQVESKKVDRVDIQIEDLNKKVLRTELSKSLTFLDLLFPFPLSMVLKTESTPDRTIKIFSAPLEDWIVNTREKIAEIEERVLTNPFSVSEVAGAEYLAFQTFNKKLVRSGLLQGPVREWAQGQV